MSTSHTGSCHCGAVRYRAALDLGKGTLKCNCSICSKSRAWLAAVGKSRFELLQGSEALRVYQFGAHRLEHHFCARCGTRLFGRTADESDLLMIQVATLDDIAPHELAAMPVMYVDGKHDRFDRAPENTAGM